MKLFLYIELILQKNKSNNRLFLEFLFHETYDVYATYTQLNLQHVLTITNRLAL